MQRANKSIGETGAVFEALGLDPSVGPVQMRKNIESRRDATAEAAARRERLRLAIAHKTYEFNTHGVEMNQRYRSAAVVPDGTPEPAFVRDRELYYHATTWPGAHLPHVWLQRDGRMVSTLDIAGKGRFVVLTGIGGQAWCDAAQHISAALGVDIAAFMIGPGQDLTDLYGDWAEAREVGEDGCVLVRPDAHVGWRTAASGDERQRLLEVMGSILGRPEGRGV